MDEDEKNPPTTPPATPPITPPATPPPADTFAPVTTQAEFDRRVQDRIQRVEAKYADYDTVKDRLSKIEKQNETETQRREREAREAAARETETTLTTQFREKEGKLKDRLIRQQITQEATTQGFRYPDDVVEKLISRLDAEGITIGDDYTVSGVDKAVKKLAESRPDWIGGDGEWKGSPPGARGAGGNSPTYDIKAIQEEQAARVTPAVGGRRM